MIRLHSISISRFRGICEGSIASLADVSILVGPNNSGKSTVAEAITRVARAVGEGTDPLGRNPAEVWAASRASKLVQPDLWYRSDHTYPICLRAQFNTNSLSLDYTVECKDPSDEFRKDRHLPAHPNKLDEYEAAEQFARRLTVFLPSDATNKEIEGHLWGELLASRRDKILTASLNEVFKMQAEGIQTLPDQRLMVVFPEYSVSLDHLGDGSRFALRCLMLLSLLRSTLFILEEPETYQHPGAMERLARAICKQAKEREIQLLISTQSAECLRSYLSASNDSGLESAVFHLRLEDGRLDAKRLDAETVKTLETTGVDVRYLDLYA